jgi:hypothetical protein
MRAPNFFFLLHVTGDNTICSNSYQMITITKLVQADDKLLLTLNSRKSVLTCDDAPSYTSRLTYSACNSFRHTIDTGHTIGSLFDWTAQSPGIFWSDLVWGTGVEYFRLHSPLTTSIVLGIPSEMLCMALSLEIAGVHQAPAGTVS